MKKIIILLSFGLLFSPFAEARTAVGQGSPAASVNYGEQGGAVSSPFSPVKLSKLALWLDASDLRTVTKDGSNRVSAWLDKSGRGNTVTQSTDGNKPVWTVNQSGGNPALIFTAASAQVLKKSTPAVLGGMTNMSVYSVWKSTINGADGSLMAVDDIGGLGRSWSINRDGTTPFNVRAYLDGASGGSVYLAGVTGTSNTYRLFKLTYTGSTGATLLSYGALSSASNMGSAQALETVTSNLCIGCLELSAVAANLLQGGVAEIIVTSGILDTYENYQISRTQNVKWGL